MIQNTIQSIPIEWYSLTSELKVEREAVLRNKIQNAIVDGYVKMAQNGTHFVFLNINPINEPISLWANLIGQVCAQMQLPDTYTIDYKRLNAPVVFMTRSGDGLDHEKLEKMWNENM